MQLRTRLTAALACAAMTANTGCSGDDTSGILTDAGIDVRDNALRDVSLASDVMGSAVLDASVVRADAANAPPDVPTTADALDSEALLREAAAPTPDTRIEDTTVPDLGNADVANEAATDATPVVYDLVKRPRPTCSGVTDSGRAKHVLFFLGDGMGIPVITAARIGLVGEAGKLNMEKLPETAFVRTYSNDALVTDSAPSMTAYMSGVKTNNDVIGMTPDTKFSKTSSPGTGKPVQTLLELAEEAGYRTGVVTTTRVTHATPAATYSHISNRDDEQAIAAQLTPGSLGFNSNLRNGLEVILGGGFLQFQGSSRSDRQDLLGAFVRAGYTFTGDTTSFRALSGDKIPARLVGLFTASHMSYEADRDNSKEPSLAEMTVKAIDVLNHGNENGNWFMMVEGGRIDHALHDSNAYRAIADTKAFDDAIKAALEKVDLTNTVVVVTADHDHVMVHHGYAARRVHTTVGNPDILGLVRKYREPSAFELDQEGKEYTVLGFVNGQNRPTNGRTSLLNTTVPDGGGTPDPEMTVMDKGYRQESAIRMSSGGETHGGQDVALFAAGVGAHQFHGIMTNTEVFDLLRCSSGL